MKEKISRAEVEHIAQLARIELSEPEKQKFQQQMATILDYVDKINEVDTTGVEPTWQVTGLENVQRPDKVRVYKKTAELVTAAPDSREGQVRVKAVFKIQNAKRKT